MFKDTGSILFNSELKCYIDMFYFASTLINLVFSAEEIQVYGHCPRNL